MNPEESPRFYGWMQSDSDSRKVTKNLTLSCPVDLKRAVVKSFGGTQANAALGFAITSTTENAASRCRIVESRSSIYSDLSIKFDHTSLSPGGLRKSK